MSTIRILLVDDYLRWQHYVSSLLETMIEFEVIAVAADGLEAVQKAGELQPDLILLDIGLPKLNGIEAARRIRNLSPNSKILFVSQETSSELVKEALQLGAMGYLVKSDAASELLLGVEAVLRGEQFVSSSLKPHATSNIDLYPAGHSPSIGRFPRLPRKGRTNRVHEVASCRTETSLVDDFARFIETNLKRGNAVIVAASGQHRIGILQRLQARGLDVAAAIQGGTYVSLDVNETLSTFMVNDWPDADKLSKVAANLIQEAAQTVRGEHSRVVICGECAPTLWTQGKGEAAMELERLWDQIARSYDLDILCGYVLDDSQDNENSPIFKRICAVHSAVRSL